MITFEKETVKALNNFYNLINSKDKKINDIKEKIAREETNFTLIELFITL